MGKYARALTERHAEVLGQIQRKQRRQASHTAPIDSYFPLAMLPGVVESITSGVMVYINGATTASGPMPYLASYTPADGDNVLLAPMGVQQTYVVLGVLTYPEEPGG